MEWVTQFRFGGGAGEVDFALPSKDTDTRDPNALDIIVGPGQSQAQVLDRTTMSPIQLPMLRSLTGGSFAGPARPPLRGAE